MFKLSAIQEILDSTEPIFSFGDGTHEDFMAKRHKTPWIRVAMQDPGCGWKPGG